MMRSGEQPMVMKQAILYMGFNGPRGHKRGVENVIAIQAASLESGIRKYFLYHGDRDEVLRWGDIVVIGIKLGWLRWIKLNCIVARLESKLRRRGYRLTIHSHSYLSTLFLARSTDIFTVHDGLFYQMKSVGKKIPSLFALIELLVYARVKLIQCNSKFTWDNSLLKHARKDVRVIYCSTPLEKLQATMDQTLPLNKNASATVLSVRSIEKRARIDLLLEVAARYDADGHRVHFLVAGKGPLLEHYRAEIRRRGIGNLELLGYVSDERLVDLYRRCDLLLMLCEYGEGFGLPAIEGYLFGKPVVASNRCAVPEVIQSPDYLVENDPSSIRATLDRTLAETQSAGKWSDYYQKRFSNRVIEHEFAQMYADNSLRHPRA